MVIILINIDKAHTGRINSGSVGGGIALESGDAWNAPRHEEVESVLDTVDFEEKLVRSRSSGDLILCIKVDGRTASEERC